jgi:hypothetical protein
VGGRTYFGPNDAWRLQGIPHGFDDDKFKYGFVWKWMVDKKRIILRQEIGEI